MAYIDGILIPVKTARKVEFIAFAKVAAEVFRSHGAVRVVDSWGEDVPDGKLTSMPIALKLEADETVVFSWVEWPDKATREAGFEAAMKDPRFQNPADYPMVMQRVIFGGFDVVSDA